MTGNSVRAKCAVRDRETVIMMMNVLGPWSVARITVGSITHCYKSCKGCLEGF